VTQTVSTKIYIFDIVKLKTDHYSSTFQKHIFKDRINFPGLSRAWKIRRNNFEGGLLRTFQEAWVECRKHAACTQDHSRSLRTSCNIVSGTTRDHAECRGWVMSGQCHAVGMDARHETALQAGQPLFSRVNSCITQRHARVQTLD